MQSVTATTSKTAMTMIVTCAFPFDLLIVPVKLNQVKIQLKQKQIVLKH